MNSIFHDWFRQTMETSGVRRRSFGQFAQMLKKSKQRSLRALQYNLIATSDEACQSAYRALADDGILYFEPHATVER